MFPQSPLARRLLAAGLSVGALSVAVILGIGVCAPPVHGQGGAAKPADELKVVKTWKVGGEGRWDYVIVDPQAKRLYVPRSDRVMVLNTEDGSVVGEVKDTPGIHGVAVVPDLNRAFTSNGSDNSLTVFDTKTLATIGKVKAGNKPDAIIYDPASKRVFAFNGRSKNLTAVDAAVDPAKDANSGKAVDLGGAPEFAVADGQGHVYCNLEDKSEVVQVDSKELKVTARWPLAPGDSPSGLAIDAAHRRLFSGCHNKMMIVMDADTGKVLANLPIGQGVDACAFDPEKSLAFASCGDSTLTVIKEESPDKFVVAQTVTTPKGARTMALDSVAHRLYLPTAEFGAPAAGQPNGRPAMMPGSFMIVVVDKQ